MMIIVDDRRARGIRAEPSEAIAVENPRLLDDAGRRSQRAGTHPNIP